MDYKFNKVNQTRRKIDLQYAADFSDDRILVGSSHNIFIGKVVSEVGRKDRGIGPETQFQVEVIDNIKGNLKAEVTVDQQGGYRNGILYLAGGKEDTIVPNDESPYLLKVGSTYLLSTRYNATENWYTLNPYPTASKLLSSANLSASQLKELLQSDARVIDLRNAYPHEILLDADVQHGNALNSFEKSKRDQIQALDTKSTNAVITP